MYITKIVTHSGSHHADELFAICMIKMFVKDADKIQVERVSVVPDKYLRDKSVMVIDVGRQYDVKLRNFDHHHDPSLPAACILVGKEVCPEEIYSDLERYLLGYVSDVDTGKIWSDFPSVNNLLRNYDSFDDAILVATIILRGYITSAYKAIQSREQWKSLEKIDGIAINRGKSPIMDWKYMAKKENIYIMITPSDRDEGWNVISRDVDVIKLTPDENQIFLHNEGFIAVYPAFETAFKKAKESVKLINHES